LVVNWVRNGDEIRNFIDVNTGRTFSRPQNVESYFHAGLTWPIKNRFTFKPWPLPSGCIFAHVGPSGFVFSENNLLSYQGLFSSSAFTALLRLTAGWNFEVGVVKRTPVPDLSGPDGKQLGEFASQCIELQRYIEMADETAHTFHQQSFSLINGETLNARFKAWEARLGETERQLAEYQREIDNLAFILYGIDGDDSRVIIESLDGAIGLGADDETEESESAPVANAFALTSDLLSYLLGCTFGRWDIRVALDPALAPKLQDPFDPLPVCPPGMLIGPDGLPATPGNIVSEAWLRARPNAITLPELNDDGRKTKDGSPATISDTEYPLRIAWDGILVDDPGLDGQTLHDADIVRRVREALAVLWGDRADAIEAEACELLGVNDLRDYFRKPSGFFADHLKRYSKSRRQAPIYWPLSTASGGYTVWVYYHRLTADTLHTIVNRFVTPKIENTQQRAEVLAEKLAAASGKAATDLRGQHDEAKTLLSELTDFRAELLRIAALPYKPNLNDGVILNAASLHKLFRLSKWAKDCKAAWDKLVAGDYEWAHLAYTLWPKRVEKVCETDRSIAIAHGLEHLCKVEAKKPKARRKKKGGEDEAMEMDLE
jgi:hypothetical protein